MADEEKSLQEFAELQQKIMIHTDLYNRLQQIERQATFGKNKCGLTSGELLSMPEDTVTYKGIGRAYFRSPKADILAELETQANAHDAEANKCKEQRETVDAKLKDIENQLRELLSTTPALVNRLGAVKI